MSNITGKSACEEQAVQLTMSAAPWGKGASGHPSFWDYEMFGAQLRKPGSWHGKSGRWLLIFPAECLRFGDL